MSLRARLIIGLLALAAVGLVALAAVTYAEQRNFLYDRVDEQAHAAVNFPIFRDGFDRGRGGPGGPGGGDGPAGGLPSGTWIFLQDANGTTVESQPVSEYAATATAPELPNDLPTGEV